MFIFYKKKFIRIFCLLSQKLKPKLFIKKSKILSNEDGMATLETIPLLVVFMVLMTYAMGFWGTVHSSILNSIAARTYAFETFRNRSNLLQFRQSGEENSKKHYTDSGFRLHAIMSEEADVSNPEFIATRRPISFSNFQTKRKDQDGQLIGDGATIHSNITASGGNGRGPSSAPPGEGVDPIWIQIGYGYCLNVDCGDEE